MNMVFKLNVLNNFLNFCSWWLPCFDTKNVVNILATFTLVCDYKPSMGKAVRNLVFATFYKLLGVI